jgi:hypothetical protein
MDHGHERVVLVPGCPTTDGFQWLRTARREATAPRTLMARDRGACDTASVERIQEVGCA